jgi:hypothetical protein
VGKKMVKKNQPPPSHKPDAALVKQVAAEAVAHVAGSLPHDEDIPGVTGATPHAVGALKFPKIDFSKLAGKLVGPALELAMMAGDGKIDPAEAARIAKLVADLVAGIVKKDGTAPGPMAA